MVGVFIIFQRFNIGLVDMRTHSIANGVVSRDVVSFQVSNQEVVSEEIFVWVMGLPVHDTLIVILTILKDYQLCGGIYALGEILANTTSRCCHLS